jgi:flagellar basal-body rod protein FlgC
MSSMWSAINASASGLDAQRARMEVAASNLANADSVHGPNNQPYRRREVMLESSDPDGFGATLTRASGSGVEAAGVKVTDVVEDQSPFGRRYEPSSPDADSDGYVATPNVSVPEEMVDMLGAARAYQANLAAIGVVKDTIQKALDLAK